MENEGHYISNELTSDGNLPLFTPESFVNSLGKTLGEANRLITMLLRHEGLGELVPSHGDILIYLFSSENTVTMQTLASVIHRDPSTVTALVKKLTVAGYVHTEKNPTDRRVTEVSLTAVGRKLQDRFQKISSALVDAQMNGIDSAAFAITCKTLNIIKENFAQACERLDEEGDRR